MVKFIIDFGVEMVGILLHGFGPILPSLLLIISKEGSNGLLIENITHLANVRLSHLVIILVKKLRMSFHQQLSDACQDPFALGYRV